MIKEVVGAFIDMLVDKYCEKKPYTKEELGNFYMIENGKYVCCFNETGDCFMEEYNTWEEVQEELA